MEHTRFSFRTTIDRPYEEVVEKTREALKAEGFGVLTEIDVKETLKKKLEVDFRKYVILGACNPPLAHQALDSGLWTLGSRLWALDLNLEPKAQSLKPDHYEQQKRVSLVKRGISLTKQ